MLQQIQSDAASMEQEAIHDEQDAQSAYETFVKDSNASIEAKQRDITDKTEFKATSAADLTQTKEDHAAVITELEQLASYAASVHQACDFVLKNFDIRQTARDQEIEALKQAKAILSGMK
ncbi:unnamed protein product [Vitrella brassicaformis CCMP3155]|uniref:Uncharacterized protein n=1 Tax=Vitrella brassicaformis (strain CCMP3155) TaxID=1169540 RepID=A0A0G4GGF9_VITBC|nr:unnamed protein product [Vitrella brassicaformis CCMP3155]|eukprot:CEM28710.1 unnamed protein product [Vitrella brassicaformis CCMP3155]